MPFSFDVPHTPVNARDPASKPILLQGAIEGHVLVKNINKTLPLKKPQLLSIFGYDAIAPSQMNVPDTGEFLGPWVFGWDSQPVGNSWVDPLPLIAINGTLISGGKDHFSAPLFVV